MPKRARTTKAELDVAGRKISISNLDKILYPAAGFTKAQVLDYYIRAAGFLLPHFENRPVTLKRFPDGVKGDFFYEKDAPSFAPEWIERYPVPRRAGGPDIQYILVNDLPTLVWCANVASLELHPFLHRVPEIQQPTSVVFDLDPGEGTDVLSCAHVAFRLREVMQGLGLECFAKVSGSKGIQVYLPLNTEVTYAVTQPFARTVAELLAKQHPKLIVAEMAKAERAKKVFIDWSQNADFKTTVGVYSLRAKRSQPFASLPVTWEELDKALKDRKTDRLYFSPESALKRLARVGDLFAPVLKLKQTLPESIRQAATAQTARSTAPSRSLREYNRKRDFSQTAEPLPTMPRASKQGSRKRFVVQKHAASHLHYDFRLEMHNVLKSWAVPKGVPFELEERRLAMATEDHPLEYLEFEGIIPPGQYGGGTVMVWDIGTYELVEGNYYKGDITFHLKGKKLKGDWQLKRDRTEAGNKWILLKLNESLKPPNAKKLQTSALTGRTMEQIAEDRAVQWHSNRAPIPDLDLDRLPKSPMSFIEPMQCQLVSKLPDGEDWEYEVKWDGYRALTIKDHGEVRIVSRRGNMLNSDFPELAEACEALEDGVIVDGEIVALDAEGRPSFNLLQHHKSNSQSVIFYAFDLLTYRNRSVTGLPLRQRRELLNSVLTDSPQPVRLSAVLKGDVTDLLRAVEQQGLEGIVAKRAESNYEPGERSANWVKYKVHRGQEFVVGGYRLGKNSFDNLAIGYYDRDRLLFIAKLKNGFTPESKRQISEQVTRLETDVCPFSNLPEPKNARRGEALTAEAMKNYAWLKPKLVVQVGFADWTAANHLRHAYFLGLREDKDAREVVKEIA